MAEENHSLEQKKLTELAAWQRKLMPWMVLLPTTLIGAFIVLATFRVNEFEKYIYHGNESFIDKTLPNPNTFPVDSTSDSRMSYLKLYTFSKMEEYSLNLRYNQAGVSIMSGIFTKYLGFFTGMILAIVGSVFIISKLKEDTTELDATVQEKIKLRLVSSSPGVIFGVLGTALMIITVLKKTEIDVKDMPLYLNQYNIPLEALKNNVKTLPVPGTQDENKVTDKEAENSTP